MHLFTGGNFQSKKGENTTKLTCLSEGWKISGTVVVSQGKDFDTLFHRLDGKEGRGEIVIPTRGQTAMVV
jgi:hypothetical protein